MDMHDATAMSYKLSGFPFLCKSSRDLKVGKQRGKFYMRAFLYNENIEKSLFECTPIIIYIFAECYIFLLDIIMTFFSSKEKRKRSKKAGEDDDDEQ